MVNGLWTQYAKDEISIKKVFSPHGHSVALVSIG
jgi:hypothetical protein